MKACFWIILLWVCTDLVWAQGDLLFVEIDTVEGQLVQEILDEKDNTKRIALLHLFAQNYTKHEAIPWVYRQLQLEAVKEKKVDKVLELGEKIVSLSPGSVEAAHEALQAAESKKDADLTLKWAECVRRAIAEVKGSMKPVDEEMEAVWKSRMDFAGQAEAYLEYSLYLVARSIEGDGKAKLMAKLKEMNPASQYLTALTVSTAPAITAPTVRLPTSAEDMVRQAEQAVAGNNADLEQLLIVAQTLMGRRRDPEKLVRVCSKIIQMAEANQRPSHYTDADWDKHKRRILSTAYWMMGLTQSAQGSYGAADRTLRAGLGYLRGDSQMLAGALYHLGYANYRLAEGGDRIRIHDAVKYMEQCVGIQSAVQEQARQNLAAMKAEYNLSVIK